MRPEDVPEEWVLAAWNGWVAGKQDGMHGDAIRAGLAAVAPLIRRAALEEAAGVAETAAISWESDAPACKSHLAERECLASAEAAQSIAAAIRALDT
jgi:hypothetical protein